MTRLAIVGGNGILGTDFGAGTASVEVAGLRLLEAENHVLLQRHSLDRYVLPHAIDHVAHAAALAQLGCDRVLALGSVGSLRAESGVGSLLAPDDFVAFGPSPTRFSDARAHAAHGFDAKWRRRVLRAFGDAGAAVVDGGVYQQTSGPRFETPAEIAIFARHAHVVGMTLASECVAMGERGLAYAAICTVDNMANGLGGGPLTADEVERGKVDNSHRLQSLLDAVIPELTAATS